jgi:ABC-type multidrug transport system fused ATPase/permease subunit
LVEIESGTILLDGVDLSRLGLSDVRGRKNGTSIIPQVFTRFVSNGSSYRVVSNDCSLLVILTLMLA